MIESKIPFVVPGGPVKLVAKLCAKAGYDVDGATVEWAESIDSEDA